MVGRELVGHGRRAFKVPDRTMMLVLKVPTRAVMNVMGWSQVNMTSRYQHVPTEVLTGIADQVGGLLWAPPPVEQDGDTAMLGLRHRRHKRGN
jgi:hypothetical protein